MKKVVLFGEVGLLREQACLCAITHVELAEDVIDVVLDGADAER